MHLWFRVFFRFRLLGSRRRPAPRPRIGLMPVFRSLRLNHSRRRFYALAGYVAHDPSSPLRPATPLGGFAWRRSMLPLSVPASPDSCLLESRAAELRLCLAGSREAGSPGQPAAALFLDSAKVWR